MDYNEKKFCELVKNVIHPMEKTQVVGEFDWTFLIQLAKKQNILPLFLEEAIKYLTYTSRPECAQEVQEALVIVSAQIKRTEALLETYKILAENNIAPILMKGIVCRQLYGRLCDHRPSGDEDLLIHPTQYMNVKTILLKNGYLTDIEKEVEIDKHLDKLQEVSFVHPTNKLHIELHLNVMGRENDARACMSDYFKNVFDSYQEIEINGVKIRTMTHDQHLLYLILHAFRHFTSGGLGIRQMLDILLYQEQYGEEIDLTWLNQTLKKFRANFFWSDMVCIGNTWFGFNLKLLEKPRCPKELLDDMFFCGVFGNDTLEKRVAARTTMFAAGNYLKNKRCSAFVMFFKSLFPNKIYLLENYSYLRNRPWLLPVAWITRWFRFIKKSKINNVNLANDSLKISRQRMKLLKKYDLV